MNPSIVNNRLSMSFSNSGYVPVSGYEVYRSRTTPVDTTVPANHFGGGGTSFQATVSENEYDYNYAVVAVSTYGVRSVPSFSFRPHVVPLTQLPLPVNAVQTVPGDGQVQLLWDAYPQSPTEQVVVGYRVYRSTTPGFTKETAESSVLTHVTTYTDKGLTNGTTYYYAVASVAETGTESALSPEVMATPTA
ncbi:hypothetical protein [Streptomyces sp. NBC_01451]|uniref:hypothetical protein n=1 Tax=Streptomyces sp. NBC_01451 TaxID=2903872 RepID=UPI002E2EF367|nr:hypothetical protein [Streptomyces sp. NBC_01451]